MVVRNFVASGRSVAEMALAIAPRREDDDEVVKLLAIGPPGAVEDTIRVLALRGFAHAYEWSPMQPTQNPGEVMSLMRRRVRRMV
ncbi:MAG: hypothetical protein Fur0042_27920 [Cyanophyceae cyanobacterium]